MADALAVAVTIRAIDALTAPTRNMAAQMQRLRSQTGQTEESLARLESRMKKFKNMTLVGAGVTLAGVGLAKGLVDAADAAGRLQTKMLNVQSALKLNNSELQKATQLAQTVGIPTMFSSEQMGDIMQTMGNSGLSKKQVLDPKMLSAYASFAEIQKRKNNTDPTESVGAAVGMAHQYQMYSTKQINPFLNSLNAALLHTNATPSEFGTTFKYISQQSRSMGMNANQSLATTAWLDRMGFGNGRGGTNFADFLQRSIYGSSGKKADSAMATAGFVKNGHSVFENNKGHFVGIQKASQILQDFSKRFGNNSNKTSPLLHSIFGTQGGRIAQMMMSKGASEQYTNVQKQMNGTQSIKSTQEKLNQSWEGQTNQLRTTLKDIQQVFGQSLMGLFLGPLKGLNKFFAKVLELAQAHKKIVAFVATFAAIAAAILLVIGPLMLLTGAIGFLKESGMIVAGIRAIGTAFMGMLGPVSIIIGVIALLYVAWTHNWGGIQQKAKAVMDWLKKEIPVAIAVVKTEFNKIKPYVVAAWNNVKKATITAWNTIKAYMGPIIKSVVKTITGAFNQFMSWWRSIWPEVKQIATFIWPIIKTYIGGELKAIWIVISTVMKIIWTGMKLAWDVISVTVKVVWTLIKDYIQTAWDLISGIIKVGLDILTGHWSKAWKDLKTLTSKLWKDIGKLFVDGWNGLGKIASTWVKDAFKWGQSIISGLISGIGSMWGNLTSTTSKIWSQITHPGSTINVSGAKSGGSTTVHVHSGAIQVNGSKNSKATAKEVVSQMGNLARSNNMSRSLGPNSLIFNGG